MLMEPPPPSRRLPRWTAPAALVLVAAVVAVAVFAAGRHRTAPSAASESLPSSPTALPTFDLASFRRLLVTLHGKPVVVNIWASWCGPCVQEAPALAAVARQYQGKVQFVGVDITDQLPAARAFIQRYGWPYPSVFDPAGAIKSGLGYLGQPVTIVYDANGAKVDEANGPSSRSQLAGVLSRLVQA